MRKQTDTRHLILNLCINFKRSGYIKRNPKEVSDSRWPAHLLLHLLHFTGFFCPLPTIHPLQTLTSHLTCLILEAPEFTR